MRFSNTAPHTTSISMLPHSPRSTALMFQRLFVFLLISAAAPVLLAHAQTLRPVLLTASDMADGPVTLSPAWTFHTDADTLTVGVSTETRLSPGDTPETWNGLGWFRLALRIDSSLVGTPLGLEMQQFGASEVYLDGRLLHRFGQPARSADEQKSVLFPNVVALPITDTRVRELAIRYANPHTEALHEVSYDAGFSATVGRLDDMTATQAETIRAATFVQIGLSGMYLAFGLLHLFLFVFYPRMWAHLFFAIVAVCIAAVAFFNYQEALFANGPRELIAIRRVWSPLTILTVLALLRFIYDVYFEHVPQHFRVLVAIGVVIGIWGWFNPNLGWIAPAGGRTYAYAFALVIHAEMLRATALAIYQHKYRALVLGIGVVAFVLAFSYPLLVVLGVLSTVGVAETLTFSFFVILGLLLSISIYLSFDYARINKDLRLQLARVEDLSKQRLEQERRLRKEEVQRKLLEAEYEQKLKELEEARELQLSMLPHTMPQHPQLELAAYMHPATEVGGDYYDFATAADGTLTVAVGDATGHGMKAGTMVTATKSLFNALGREDNLLGIFDRSTRALKGMNLRQLYMALTLAKFQNSTLRLATAGMPPTLVYRAATGSVEIVRLTGMPLGSFVNFPYQEETIVLSPGDTVLFMSDGFPELFNPEGKMLGYDHAVEVFGEVAQESAETIIAHLVDLSQSWADGHPPADDVTFVVLKMR